MSQKKAIERYAHLRVLIMRAKEDAECWGTGRQPMILQGIKEKSSHDYTVYDDAYNKFVKKRIDAMNEKKLNRAKEEEADKRNQIPSYTEIQLTRIADALEHIAGLLSDELEKQEFKN